MNVLLAKTTHEILLTAMVVPSLLDFGKLQLEERCDAVLGTTWTDKLRLAPIYLLTELRGFDAGGLANYRRQHRRYSCPTPSGSEP